MLERLIRNTNQKLTKSYELVPVTLSYLCCLWIDSCMSSDP